MLSDLKFAARLAEGCCAMSVKAARRAARVDPVIALRTE